MPFFRSKRDYSFFKRINRELIERVIGEKITYYPISKEMSETNFYGESKTKIVDPPVFVHALVSWGTQETATTEFGQDIIYNLKVYILKDHLDIIGLEPKEGDMIDYHNIKFEIASATVDKLLFGKEGEEMGTTLSCVSVRDNTFKINVSASIPLHKPTAPDNSNPPTTHFDNVSFPRSGSFYT